jgi:hypothetical protein
MKVADRDCRIYEWNALGTVFVVNRHQVLPAAICLGLDASRAI